LPAIGHAAPRARILVVDDDPSTRELLGALLGFEGYEVIAAATPAQALDGLEQARFDVVLLDLHLPGVVGGELLTRIRGREGAPPVIVITGDGRVDSAVEAMRLGAADYITKPIRTAGLLVGLERVLPRGGRGVEPPQPRPEPVRPADHGFVGDSPGIRRVFALVGQVAPLGASVLITGETGTGKELVARAIHRLSPRADRTFLPVQCSALAPSLLESELFGHVKGSFTGAVANRRGVFEEAHGGTLFLDEIGTIPPDTQVKILRVLQERRVQRVGASSSVPVDFRLIGATNVDLGAEVEAGRFREDLYYRLNVFPIRIPPLRARREDIPLLAEAFRERFARENGSEPPAIPRATLAEMQAYGWPGNVRELENYVERGLILAPASAGEFPSIGPADQSARQLLARAADADWPLARLEREYVLEVLERVGGRRAKAVEVLGISRRTLYRKLRDWKESGQAPDAADVGRGAD
jgi:DNA-binding NtrC family response regulator